MYVLGLVVCGLIAYLVFFQFLLEGGHGSVGAGCEREGIPDGRVVGVEMFGLELGFFVFGVLSGCSCTCAIQR